MVYTPLKVENHSNLSKLSYVTGKFKLLSQFKRYANFPHIEPKFVKLFVSVKNPETTNLKENTK